MLGDGGYDSVYLVFVSTDMRKTIYGPADIVSASLQMDLFSPSLFVPCNRQRDTLKIPRWDHCGFWPYDRRAERGRFKGPHTNPGGAPLAVVTRRQFQ